MAESTPAPKGPPSAWWLYVVRCSDDTLYTGIARDVPRRLSQHNGELAGGARYTSGRRPVELLHRESYPDRSAALRAEFQFKQLSKQDKHRRIRGRDRSESA